MKGKLSLIVAASVLLAAASVAVYAAGPKPSPVIGSDGKTVFTAAVPSNSKASTTPAPDDGTVTIYDNLAEVYPKGLYNCCQGAIVSGPDSPGFTEWWDAVAFTPSTNVSITEIELALGYESGTNQVILTLANDASGLPGTRIRSWILKDIPLAGTCCDLVTVNDNHGIAVTAGVQYWLMLTTNGADRDAFFSWNVNDTDQIDSALGAARCRGLGCRGNGEWVATQESPALAYAIFGK